MADPMDLEAADAPPAPPPVAEPPAPPPPPPDPDAAGAVDVPNVGPHVPLSALKAVREELKAAKDRASALEQQVTAQQPAIEFLNRNPQLLRPQQPQAPPQPAQDDPDLVEIAQTLDFYKTDGTLDLVKAKRHQAIVNKQAANIAQQVVQPVAMGHWQQAAQQNYSRALQEKLPNGAAIDKSLLDVAWVAVQQRSPAALSDPNTLRFIVNNVIAEQMRANPLGFQQVAPPPHPPVHTANVGARPAQASGMTDVHRAIVGTRMDDKKFGDITKGFTAGRGNVLED